MSQTAKRLVPGVIVLVLLLALLAGMTAGCGSSSSGDSSSSGGGAAKQGGVLRIGTQYIPNSMNPFVAYMVSGYNTFEYIYPHMVSYDTKDKALPIVPNFATKWETSADGKTWTFQTVPGAKWSDGQPLTAADVAFTINTVVKYAKGPSASIAALCGNIKSAQATDANTLVITMSKPSANLLSNFVRLSILPQHVWEQYATGNGAKLKTYPNNAPVVSGGPFMLTEYAKNDHLLCERNPNWWGTKPLIDGFGVKFYSSQDAEVLALKNGEIDYVTPLPPTSVESVKAAGFAVNDAPGILEHEIDINSNPKMKAHRELLIPEVRLAMAHALDIQKFIDVAYQGHAQPAGAWIPPATGDWSNPNIKAETYDLTLAGQLLDQAGCKLGSDGVRTYNGAKMEYDVIFPTDERGPGDRVFQIYQADFKTLGIILHQKSVDNTTAYTLISASNFSEFAMAQWSWTAQIDPDFMLSIFTTDQWGALADTGYSNPAYDKLYKEQNTTIDPAKRRAIVWQMQDILYKDKPYIPTIYGNWVEAISPKWEGLVPSPRGAWNDLSSQTLLEAHLK